MSSETEALTASITALQGRIETLQAEKFEAEQLLEELYSLKSTVVSKQYGFSGQLAAQRARIGRFAHVSNANIAHACSQRYAQAYGTSFESEISSTFENYLSNVDGCIAETEEKIRCLANQATQVEQEMASKRAKLAKAIEDESAASC